jgi:type I restriction enzyme R subunit
VVVRNAYTKTVYVDRAFQKKTNALVRAHIGAEQLVKVAEFVKIDENTIDLIKRQKGGDGTKVINLVKSIEKAADENSDDPFLIALAERATAVQTAFEDRQTETAEALSEVIKEVERNEKRKKEQAEKGLDAIGYFVLCKLMDDGIKNADTASRKVAQSFAKYPNWQHSEAELRELRNQVTFALVREEDSVEKVTATVEALFTLLRKSFKP